MPQHVSADELFQYTTELACDEAGERITECAACRPVQPHLASCRQRHHEGRVPAWEDQVGIVWNECPRYHPWLAGYRMRHWGFPMRMCDAPLDRTTEEGQQVGLYVDAFEHCAGQGWGLAVYGGVGAGKTTLLCAAVRELLLRQAITTAWFWDAAQLLDRLRPSDASRDEQRSLVMRCSYVDVLVLDDVGSHKSSDWVREQLGMLINHRWSHRMVTCITSNASRDVLDASLGERTTSRILDGAISVHLAHEDRREVPVGEQQGGVE